MMVQVGATRYAIDRRSFTIGRDAACDVVIDDPGAIAHHVTATWQRPDRTEGLALALHAPVRINDTPMTVEAAPVVRPGAIVTLGTTRLRVVDLAEPRAWWQPAGWGRPDVVTSPAPPREALGVVKQNPPPPRVVVPPPAPTSSVEATFVDAIARAPGDAAGRMVYADWLEQAGRLPAARFVRGEAFAEVDSYAWRAVVARLPITACGEPACPRTWDRLAPTGDDAATRRCGTCRRNVHYEPGWARFVTSLPYVLDDE